MAKRAAFIADEVGSKIIREYVEACEAWRRDVHAYAEALTGCGVVAVSGAFGNRYIEAFVIHEGATPPDGLYVPKRARVKEIEGVGRVVQCRPKAWEWEYLDAKGHLPAVSP